MAEERIDRLAAGLDALLSRRGLGSAAAAALTMAGLTATAAAKKKKKKKKMKKPSACTPNCAGKACGADDGCGSACQTGSCDDGETCVAGAFAELAPYVFDDQWGGHGILDGSFNSPVASPSTLPATSMSRTPGTTGSRNSPAMAAAPRQGSSSHRKR